MVGFASVRTAMADDARVLWCGNVSERADSELLRELFTQAGPVEDVSLGKDRDGRQRNYSFVRFHHEVSVGYALELLKGTRLFDRTLALQARNRSQASRTSPTRRHSPVEFPQVHPLPLPDFIQNAQLPADRFENVDSSNYRLAEDRRGNNLDSKGLSVASLQGNWSSRNQNIERNRSQNRYEPYKKGGNHKNKDFDYDHRRNDYNDYNDRKNYNDYDYNDRNDDRRNHRDNDNYPNKPRRKNNFRY